MQWLAGAAGEVTMMGTGTPSLRFLRRFQVETVLEPPLDWRGQQHSAYIDMMSRFQSDPEFALDALDFALHAMTETSGDPTMAMNHATDLAYLLESGRSIWRVEYIDNGQWRLERGSLGPVLETVSSLEGPAPRAHAHLVEAWKKLAGRHADPSAAWKEAVRAVEAVAKPIVTPNDQNATLGKMITAIETKPSKWAFVLGRPEDVAAMCKLIWKSQFDRHGTDDESVPLNASPEEADAAVHTAITLVRYFAGGLFKLA
jgi:hypothetical protein